MNERLPSKHIVLLGMGHTNAHVLRMYGMHGLEDTALTCISNFNVATYSGMLPAVLAGQVPREKMQIDLVQLCASVGARLITEPVTGLDPESRNILFQHRPPMEFDLLSIGTGSTSMQGELVVKGGNVVAIKPMQTFLERLQQTLTLLHEKQLSRPLRVVVAGSGAAGLEIDSVCHRFSTRIGVAITKFPLSRVAPGYLQPQTPTPEKLPSGNCINVK